MLQAAQQQKLIVYNVPQHQAIDIIQGQQYVFTGDTMLRQNASLQQFYLQPCRRLHRVTPCKGTGALLAANRLFCTGNVSVLLINKQMQLKKPGTKIPVDIIIVSQNPVLDVPLLAHTFTWQQLIFDHSNAPRKVNRWKQDCARLSLPCFSVADKGAFVFNLY